MSLNFNLIKHLPDLSGIQKQKHKAVEVAELKLVNLDKFRLLYVAGRSITSDGENYLIGGDFKKNDGIITNEDYYFSSDYSEYNVLVKIH